ncbi:DUF3892 domain-containing protein [Leptospira bourretii]|uniref:DUF3892 domain-containing protein n=1 Tax=Leptospira bourretii TaxID=2484962 RepID=UPI0010911CE1|nr:DUF3892 domain-containing protein [Leptospira bourretii]TGL20564.1 DUF3892 domain-containing protein [Leptospira bourretii]
MPDKVHYWISAVRKDSYGRIQFLKVHENSEQTFNNPTSWPRNEVIRYIESRYTFYTMTKSSGKWESGAKVNVILVNGTKYLRTDSNSIEKDNLDNLPDF